MNSRILQNQKYGKGGTCVILASLNWKENDTQLSFKTEWIQTRGHLKIVPASITGQCADFPYAWPKEWSAWCSNLWCYGIWQRWGVIFKGKNIFLHQKSYFLMKNERPSGQTRIKKSWITTATPPPPPSSCRYIIEDGRWKTSQIKLGIPLHCQSNWE